MKPMIILIIFGVTILFFQNCAKSILDSSSSISVSCSPKDKPCLRYIARISNLKLTKGAMSVLVQGDVSEGVSVDTEFSSNCEKINSTTGLCPFDTTITATIRANSTSGTVKGDGRTLTLRIPTTSSIRSESYGDLRSKITKTEGLCLISDENSPVFDGDTIALEELFACPEE